MSPIYDYECSKCGLINEQWAKIHEIIRPCPDCGGVMNRLISASNIICDIEPYLDGHMDASPVYVKSRQHKAQLLKDRGLFIK